MSKLVPTLVIDKNGKPTTVYKRPEKATKGFGNLFGVIPRGSEPSRSDLIAAILAEAEELAGGADRHIEKRVFSSIKAESLPGVLEILSHESAEPEAVYIFAERYAQSDDKSAYNEWVGEYASRYREMKAWSCGHSSGASDDTISKLVAGMIRSQSKGVSVEESEGVMRLTCALIGSGIARGIYHQVTPYGLAFSLRDDFVKRFVTRHSSPDEIEKACSLIASGNLNRLEDLDNVFSGSVPLSIAEGIL
jgi:hypothetical protein